MYHLYSISFNILYRLSLIHVLKERYEIAY